VPGWRQPGCQGFQIQFNTMKKGKVSMKSMFAAFLLCSASIAFAHCPNATVCEMKAVDSMMTDTKLQGESLEKIKTLRAEGQKLYDEGRESEALKILKEARKMLKDAAS
jgi:hypothetical protein